MFSRNFAKNSSSIEPRSFTGRDVPGLLRQAYTPGARCTPPRALLRPHRVIVLVEELHLANRALGLLHAQLMHLRLERLDGPGEGAQLLVRLLRVAGGPGDD